MDIRIEILVKAPLTVVWNAWTTPEDILCWNFASDDWCCPKAAINLGVGGQFNYRMEAKDGSSGFDFRGEFIAINPLTSIEYLLRDDRGVTVTFADSEQGVWVTETFESENENTAEPQRTGWLCILENFKKHVEAK